MFVNNLYIRGIHMNKFILVAETGSDQSAIIASEDRDYAEAYHLRKDEVWLGYTIGLSDEVKEWVEKAAKECGFEKIKWVQAAGVITTHGGPAAFGFTGFTE